MMSGGEKDGDLSGVESRPKPAAWETEHGIPAGWQTELGMPQRAGGGPGRPHVNWEGAAVSEYGPEPDFPGPLPTLGNPVLCLTNATVRARLRSPGE